MRKHFATLILLFASFSLASQNLEGNYKDRNDSLSFSDGKVIFNIGGFSGLYVNKKGEGAYEQVGDYLLIHTSGYSGEKTNMQSMEGSMNDSLVIKVMDSQNFSVQGVYAEWLNASGKPLGGSVSDDSGKIQYKKNPKIRKIKVGLLGYDEIVFNYDPNKDFLIHLAKDDVIESQTVVFKIKHENEETISVTLLSDNFDPGKDKMKSLEKLDRKVQKNNVLGKRLKKEYVSVYRR